MGPSKKESDQALINSLVESIEKEPELAKKELPLTVTYKGKRVKGTCIGFDERTREVKVRLDQYNGEVVKFTARKKDESFSQKINQALKPKRKK